MTEKHVEKVFKDFYKQQAFDLVKKYKLVYTRPGTYTGDNVCNNHGADCPSKGDADLISKDGIVFRQEFDGYQVICGMKVPIFTPEMFGLGDNGEE